MPMMGMAPRPRPACGGCGHARCTSPGPRMRVGRRCAGACVGYPERDFGQGMKGELVPRPVDHTASLLPVVDREARVEGGVKKCRRSLELRAEELQPAEGLPGRLLELDLRLGE